nr:YCF48-related protein [Ignavibacteria bacterium]
GVQAHFYNMQFVSPSIVFLGAFDGVYKSMDAGVNWLKVVNAVDAPPGNFSWRKIFFTDANTGFYASDSGIIRKTSNSGLNWSVAHVRSDLVVRDITFVNSATGFISGEAGILLRTTNTGDTWNEMPLGTNAILYSVKFPNQFIGFIAAEGKVFKTYNSGANWQEVFDQNSDSLIGAYFLNPDIGYVAGKHGKVYKTITGGVIGVNNISGEIPKEFVLSQNSTLKLTYNFQFLNQHLLSWLFMTCWAGK